MASQRYSGRFFSIPRMVIFRKYPMLPVRLGVVLIGLLSSLAVVAAGSRAGNNGTK